MRTVSETELNLRSVSTVISELCINSDVYYEEA